MKPNLLKCKLQIKSLTINMRRKRLSSVKIEGGLSLSKLGDVLLRGYTNRK